MGAVVPFAGLLFAACAAPVGPAEEVDEEAQALEVGAPRGEICRDACYAAYDRAMVVCSRKPTPQKRELCRREAAEILASCRKRCPNGHRALDEARGPATRPAWTTSSPSAS